MTSRFERRRLGKLLVVGGLVAYLLVLGVSAALAPPIEDVAASNPGSLGLGTTTAPPPTPGPGATATDRGTATDPTPADGTPPTATDAPAPADRGVVVGLQGPFGGRRGHVVLLDPRGNERWRSPEVWAHFDATPLSDGRILAAFLERGYDDCGPYDAPCSRTGFRVYDPAAADPVVREWTYPVRSHPNSEVHDAELLPTGEVLVVGMEYERVFTVDRSGEITWQWNASERYDAPADPTRTDWLHMNDVDRIGPGRFLVSVRNENQLVVIERGEGVVEVINEGGDPAVMHEQHNPQWLGEGRVLVADSENDRVVELHRTADGWEPAWAVDSVAGVDLNWPRDADRLPNGNTLITDSLNDRVVVVDGNGDLQWSVTPGPIPYEADLVPGGEYAGIDVPTTTETGTGTGRTSAGGTAGDDGNGDEDGDPNGADGGDAAPTPSGDLDRTGGGDVPVVSGLLAGVRGAAPIPYWVSEWHVVGLFATLVVELVGGWLWYDGRPDGS